MTTNTTEVKWCANFEPATWEVFSKFSGKPKEFSNSYTIGESHMHIQMSRVRGGVHIKTSVVIEGKFYYFPEVWTTLKEGRVIYKTYNPRNRPVI